jgi:GDP-4-dehydro-6-deoxy-D-mannose reductase
LKRILILGHAGFSGRYMTRYLQQISGTELYGADLNTSGILHEYQANLNEFESVNRIVEQIRPDLIINLSGLVHSDNPGLLYISNVLPVINTIQSLIRNNLSGTGLLIISSAAVYGDSGLCPIKEENPVKPVNLYGSSKLAMEQLIPVYGNFHRLRITIARTFNLMGPGLAESFSIPSFIKQLIHIKNDDAEPVIRTGNLNPARDYIDIRDAVEAYWKIATNGKPGETYNVGSGQMITMQEILDNLIALAGIEVRLEKDFTRVRKNEIMNSQADIGKIKKLGWSPRIEFGKSLQDMFDYYQQKK